jgi:hypothetical protein
MAIPEIVQTKINSVKTSLEVRYPPYNLKRLSSGYESSQDAYNDTRINSYVYSDNLNDLTIGDISYTDKTLSSPFNGGELWYHVFSEIQDDLEYAVQVGGLGQIVDTYFGNVTYTINLSNGFPDQRACGRETQENPFYTLDNTFQPGSIIYTDKNLTTPYDGRNLVYAVYDDQKNPYGVAIQINGSGQIVKLINCS